MLAPFVLNEAKFTLYNSWSSNYPSLFLIHQLFQIIHIAPTNPNDIIILHYNIITAQIFLNFFDVFEVNQRGTMYSNKAIRIEFCL